MPSNNISHPYSSEAHPHGTYIIHRRLFGLLLGAFTGLAYTTIAQNINAIVMPGIPFYQPPFGPAGNILLGIALGALLGLISAWGETGLKSVLYASLTGSLFLVIAGLVSGPTGPEDWVNKITSVIIIFIPTAALFAPVLLLFRWLANREEDAYRESQTWRTPPLLPRVGLPAALVLLAAATGLLSMYNDLGRAVTPQMGQMLRSARQAASVEQLPEPLRQQDVQYFWQNNDQPYTLQWQKDDNNQFSIPRPNTSQFDQSTVIARYKNGYLLACMFPAPGMDPHCKDYPPPQP